MRTSQPKFPSDFLSCSKYVSIILLLTLATTEVMVAALTVPKLQNPTSLQRRIFSTQASISSDEILPNSMNDSDQSPSFSYQEQNSPPSSTSPSSRSSSTATMSTTNKPTLYDILGASPNASRMELKQKYVALARMTHPDAQRIASSQDKSEESSSTTPYDFNDIATAYKILSDSKQRRRYDRSLQAEALTEQIAMAVQNHPITELTIKAIGSFAVPFFRTINKVTTTTTTSTSSLSTDTTTTTTSNESIESSPSSQATKYVTTPLKDTNLPDTQSRNFRQQEEYSSYVDNSKTTMMTEDNTSSLPTIDDTDVGLNKKKDKRKSVQELEEEAQNQYNQLLQIQQNLDQIQQQRLRVALYTPQSGLNSNEAYLLLNSFPNTDGQNGPSWVERLNFLRSSVETEINTLQNTEEAFIQQQQINTRAQNLHQNALHDQFMIRQSLIDAERVEQEARRALERAMDETRRQRIQYERISEELFAAENAAAYASNELERLQSIIQKQSENVRNALVRKEKALLNNNHSNNINKQEVSSIELSNDEVSSSSSPSSLKPEPPMSPLFTASSLHQRKLSKHMQQEQSSSPPLVQSSEASMLDAWPKQSQTTTLSQPPHQTSFTNMSLMGFVDSSYENHTNDSLDEIINDDAIISTQQEHEQQQHTFEYNMDELNKLRNQEREMIMISKTIEAHISDLMEQIREKKQ
jgi:curved DNA-binding protein CbpA